MEELISLYDNTLIYYPNVFFVVLFFTGILGTIIVGIGISILRERVRRAIKKIKSSLKRIKVEEKKKTPFNQMASIFLQKKRTSAVYIIKTSIVFFIYIIRTAVIRANTLLISIESQTERVIRKIGKEILIEE